MPPVRSFAALGLFVREAFLSPAECRDFAADMLTGAGEPATVSGDSSSGTVAGDVRRAWEVDMPRDRQTLVERRLHALLPELESHFSVALATADAPSFVRYPQGAFYRAHRDRRQTPDASGAERRAVSIVIFVNGPQGELGFSGGQLRFYGLLGDGPLAAVGIDAEPAAGTLVAFDSNLEHEVTTVERGTRLTIVTWYLERGTKNEERRG
jgi:predicted 2-oxoglutarate/Fe(II)-dependent dioxygenase YbiX